MMPSVVLNQACCLALILPPSPLPAPLMKVSLRIAYLVSYEHHGHLKLACVSGCNCTEVLFDTHNPLDRISVMKVCRRSS